MDPNYAGQGQAHPNRPSPGQQDPPEGYYPGALPKYLTIKAGTLVTVRLNQGLSSDRNRAGDGFAASLMKPVVVNGIVVAERGQTVGGRVVEAQKAGHFNGVSRLAVQLTDLTLVDGTPAAIKSQFVSNSGPTSVGRAVATVGTTTAAGAAIGAAADWGTGAAIGAGVGAIAGIVGVLATRGQPTVLYPESVMTFRLETPVTLSTEAAPQTFRYVNPGDYERPYDLQARMGPPRGAAGPPSPYYAPVRAYPYPYYWGPGFGFYIGPSFYFGRGFYGRGFYGRGFYGWRR
jgi:hypothetical protein